MRITANIFGLKLLIRVSLLSFAGILLGRILFDPNWFFAQLTLSGILLYLTFDLYRLVSTTNTKLDLFFHALEYHEYGSVIKGGLRGAYFQKLENKLNEIKQTKQQEYRVSESSLVLVQEVLDRSKIGLLILDEGGNLKLSNKTAIRLLNLPPNTNQADIKRLYPLFYKRIAELETTSSFTPDRLMFADSSGYEDLRIDHFPKSIYGHTYHMLTISSVSDSAREETSEWIQFIKLFSHEFLNGISPLYAVIQSLEYKVSGTSNEPELSDTIGFIRDQTNKLINLGNRYKNLISISSPDPEHFEWAAFLNELQLEHPDIEIKISGEAMYELVYTDRGHFQQIMRNLLLNSSEATNKDEQAKVSISITRDKTDYIIDYSDNGRGIPVELLSKVFIPFYSTREGGTGLGLSVIQQLIRLNKGKVNILRSDKGAYFRLSIPAL